MDQSSARTGSAPAHNPNIGVNTATRHMDISYGAEKHVPTLIKVLVALICLYVVTCGTVALTFTITILVKKTWEWSEPDKWFRKKISGTVFEGMGGCLKNNETYCGKVMKLPQRSIELGDIFKCLE